MGSCIVEAERHLATGDRRFVEMAEVGVTRNGNSINLTVKGATNGVTRSFLIHIDDWEKLTSVTREGH